MNITNTSYFLLINVRILCNAKDSHILSTNNAKDSHILSTKNAKDSHILSTKNNSVFAYLVSIYLTSGCLNDDVKLTKF